MTCSVLPMTGKLMLAVQWGEQHVPLHGADSGPVIGDVVVMMLRHPRIGLGLKGYTYCKTHKFTGLCSKNAKESTILYRPSSALVFIQLCNRNCTSENLPVTYPVFPLARTLELGTRFAALPAFLEIFKINHWVRSNACSCTLVHLYVFWKKKKNNDKSIVKNGNPLACYSKVSPSFSLFLSVSLSSYHYLYLWSPLC